MTCNKNISLVIILFINEFFRNKMLIGRLKMDVALVLVAS